MNIYEISFIGSSIGLGPCLTKAVVLGSSLLGGTGDLPGCSLQGPVELVEVRVSWSEHPRISKIKNKKKYLRNKNSTRKQA